MWDDLAGVLLPALAAVRAAVDGWLAAPLREDTEGVEEPDTVANTGGEGDLLLAAEGLWRARRDLVRQSEATPIPEGGTSAGAGAVALQELLARNCQ